MAQVKGGWFNFQRAPGFDFGNGPYRSYAYFVFDETVSKYATPASLSSAAIKLGFDPKYYGYDVKIVGKIRWINGKKQHFMQAGTSSDNIGNIWHYGVMTPVYQAFQRRYWVNLCQSFLALAQNLLANLQKIQFQKKQNKKR